MKSENLCRLPLKCVYLECASHLSDPKSKHLVRKYPYYRKSDGKWISRFVCKICKRSFSQARFSPCFGQKKRRLNSQIEKLLVSGVSQRRIAQLLKISRATVVRKFLFLAKQAQLDHSKLQKELHDKKLSQVFFDEMESVEISKCLPVSIPIAIDPNNRKILGFRVCSMPAKGLLASISRKKYGLRKDDRYQSISELFHELKPCLSESVEFSTDEKPAYSPWIRSVFPKSTHKTYKGRRGCVVGQGELKRGGFDPLFALNHTAAMLRANINRLFRRTWCVSKKRERLEAHILIYTRFHNRILTESFP